MRYLMFPVRFVAVLMVVGGGIVLLLGYLLIQLLTEKRPKMKYAPPIFALIFLMSCKTLPYVPVVEVPLSGLYGATNCDQNGNPIIMLDPVRRKTTLRHERQHIRDILAYPGGCRAFLQRYRAEPAFRIAMELRAYCAESVAQPDSVTLQNIAGLVRDMNNLPNSVQITNPCGTFNSVAILHGPDG